MRLPPLTLLSLAALAVTTPSLGMGLGKAPQTVLLGQPLNLSVPVLLDATESLVNACVRAEVTLGDTMLSPTAVQALIETSGEGATLQHVVRVRTHVAVEEPVVTVQLALGCPARLTRKIVAFADPPELTHFALPAMPLPAHALAPLSATEPTPSVLPDAAPRAARQVVASAGAKPAKAATAPKPAPGVAAAPPAKLAAKQDKPSLRQVVAAAAMASPAASPVAGTAATEAAAPGADTTAAGSAAPLAAVGPRLRLDTFAVSARSPVITAARDQVLASVEASAVAAVAASDAVVSIQQDRVKLLERDLKKLRAEAQANRDLARSMRSRLIDAESSSQLAPVLGGAAALLLGMAGWFAWRLRALQQEKKKAWWNAQAATAGMAEPDYGRVEPRPEGEVIDAPAQVLADVATPPLIAAPALPVISSMTAEPDARGSRRSDDDGAAQVVDSAASEVSIDELIDLEQQTDFFVLLGQDDSAIDLLLSHLRATDGSVPMAHLKLLEAYHRKGDQTAYERSRARMSHQFSCDTPEWAAEFGAGQGLEREAELVDRLVACWHQPEQAMAELQALMVGMREGKLLELNAYREALLLYSILRDVQDHAEVPARAVPQGLAGPGAATPLNAALAVPVGHSHSDNHSLDFDLEPSFLRPASGVASVPGAPGASQQGPAAAVQIELPTIDLPGDAATPGEHTATQPYLNLDLPSLDLDAPADAANMLHDQADAARTSGFVDLDLTELNDPMPPARMGELSLEPRPLRSAQG